MIMCKNQGLHFCFERHESGERKMTQTLLLLTRAWVQSPAPGERLTSISSTRRSGALFWSLGLLRWHTYVQAGETSYTTNYMNLSKKKEGVAGFSAEGGCQLYDIMKMAWWLEIDGGRVKVAEGSR